MPNWQNIVCQTAQIVANCLPFILPLAEEGGPTATATPEYHLGDVMWYAANPRPGVTGIGAYNLGDTELGLNYSRSFTNASGGDETLNVYQPLPPRSGYFATPDLLNFKDGEVCIASTVPEEIPEAEDGARKPPPRTVTASISGLMFATAWQISEQLTVAAERRQEANKVRYYLTVKPASTISIYSTSATVKDQRGSTVRGSGKLRDNSTEPMWDIAFPPGTNLEPSLSHLVVTVKVYPKSYEQITAERRSLLFKGHPHRL